MKENKLLNGITLHLFKSEYYVDSDYDSDYECTTFIVVSGFIIKETDCENSLIMFYHGKKIFCCNIPNTKYTFNEQTKQIPNDIYEKLIDNYANLNPNIILEFVGSKYFVNGVVSKSYREKIATYENRKMYFI